MSDTAADALNEREKFLLALGRFIDTFSNVEGNLKELVGAIAGIDDKTRRAMLTGARVESCMTTIRHLHKARDTTVPGELDRALSQLAVINKVRNTLLHYGAKRKAMVPRQQDTRPYLLMASNWHVVTSPNDVVRFAISTEILDQLQRDTRRIVRITRIFIGDAPDEYERKELADYAKEQWLYKLPPPENRNQRSQPKTPKPPRPRQSSRG